MKNTIVKNIIKIVFIIITLAILLFTVWSLGKPVKLPWPLSIEINQPKYASINEDAELKVFSDNDLMRLSYLDEDQKISDFDNLDIFSNSYQRYYNVWSYADKTFALHVIYDIRSGFVNKEEIVFKSGNNSNLDIIYSKEYDVSKEKFKRPQILDIWVMDNIPHVIMTENNDIKICKIENNKAIPIRSHYYACDINNIQAACYNNEADKMILTTYYGAIIQIDNNNEEKVINKDRLFPYTWPSISDDGSIFINDTKTKDLYCYKDEQFKVIAKNLDPLSARFEHGNLVVCDAESNGILLFNNSDLNNAFESNKYTQPWKSYHSIQYNFALIAYVLLTWFSYVYLFILLVLVIIWFVIKIKLSSKVKMYMGFGVIIIVGIIGISSFFTSNIYIQAENSVNGNLKTATLLAKDIGKENLENLNRQDIDVNSLIACYENMYYDWSNIIYNFAQGDKTLDIDYVNISEINYLLDIDLNNENESYSSMTNSLVESLVDNDPNDIITTKIELEQGTTLASILPVVDNENRIQGLIVTTLPANYLHSEQISNAIGLSTILIITILTILLIGLELISLKNDFMKSLKIKSGKLKAKLEITGSRFFSLLYHMVYSIDLALLVLVAKDMLSSEIIENAGLALSVPASLYALGGFFGTILIKKILEKIYARNMFVVVACIHLLAELVIVYTIINCNFILFCIFKFITGITLGCMSFSVDIIQYRTKNLSEQTLVANNNALALITSSALSTMIAGWLADSFGNEAIYIFTSALCLLFILASLWFIPKKTYFGDRASNNEQKTKSRNAIALLKFIFSHTMIVILLCTCFVPAIAYQYNSILFPLYADEAGLTKSQIGNITMICICVVFVVNNLIKNFLVNKKQVFVVIVAILCFAVPFLCFGLNQSIIWACIALGFVTFAYRTITVSQKLIWVPLVKKSDISQNKVYMVVTQVKVISTSIAPFIFMSILSLGASQTACVVGLICLFALMIFGIFSKKIN